MINHYKGKIAENGDTSTIMMAVPPSSKPNTNPVSGKAVNSDDLNSDMSEDQDESQDAANLDVQPSSSGEGKLQEGIPSKR